MNPNIAIRVRKQSWATAVGFLIAFCWLGWAAVRFGSVFEGMDIERSLPLANRFALAYGPVAFPLFGFVAAAAFILADALFPKSWMHWTLVVLFALLIAWALRSIVFSGVFMVPNTWANYPAGGNAELALGLAIDHHCLGVPQPGC